MDGAQRRRLLNVVDVEATCWDGPVPQGQANEIIEIGVCVVDLEAGERVGRDRIVVRPWRSRVGAFCTELTGLTQAEVDTGLDFRAACALLDERHLAGVRAWASWGDYDRKQFARQCSADDVDYPFSRKHTNAKRLFADAHGLPRGRGHGAGATAGGPAPGGPPPQRCRRRMEHRRAGPAAAGEGRPAEGPHLGRRPLSGVH
ncbi:exonuclease domain-containing protein [Nocardiopsis mangrovi]|uniref:Exonuclease domain-containing protein n=1 Tax=Nocardiopsis mangrovi TaxID=1179818 RepID=A0ABV9DW40_9ACTN